VPDASRISPPRIDRLHPDAAYLVVEGCVDHANGGVTDIRSPSHPLLVKDGPDCSTIRLADKTAVPDCDLVLRWADASGQALRSAAWLTRHSGESYALVRLLAPKEVVTPCEHAMDVYFLVDRSGSMMGLKWDKACEAFRAFLRVLEPQDRVWATFFETRFQDLAEKPLPPAALLSDPVVPSIETVGTGGGTELLPALRHVLESVQRHSQHRYTAIVLITDGQVGNEAEILESLRPMAEVRVHTFGIDTAVNDAFLKRLARQQRGTCHLATPQDDIVATISRLGLRLRRPVLTGIRIRGGWELAERQASDLHASEALTLSLRGSAEARQIEWEGQRADGTVAVFQCEPEQQALPAVALLWARRRIDQLQSENRLADAIVIAKQKNLICPGTAFVAWDETEKIAVGQAKLDLYQPAMEVDQFDSLLSQRRGGSAATPRLSDRVGFLSHSLNSIASHAGLPGTGQGDRPGTKGPLIRSPEPSKWRAAFEQDPLFQQNGLGMELLSWLEQWCLSDPLTRPARERQLTDLADSLKKLRHRQEPLAGQLDALRGWIEANLRDFPAFLRPLLGVLNRLAAAARVG
jgi:Ca-activated chloride channel family protein